MYNHANTNFMLFNLTESASSAEMLLKESTTLSSMHESFSSKSIHMESTMQETSFSSSTMAEMKCETMSMSSMSSITSESVYAMSSSSVMSSHSHTEGTSIRAALHSGQGQSLH